MAEYVIWSEEHGGWWLPGSYGYTQSLRQAGRYSQIEAERIVKGANAYLRPPGFHEVAIPDPLAPSRET